MKTFDCLVRMGNPKAPNFKLSRKFFLDYKLTLLNCPTIHLLGPEKSKNLSINWFHMLRLNWQCGHKDMVEYQDQSCINGYSSVKHTHGWLGLIPC